MRLRAPECFVEDKLFATLDPTTRALRLPNGDKVMIVDTVGFINKIPHSLIEAFKSTLEEVSSADLLLHLVDMANPLFEEQIQVIEKVLARDRRRRDSDDLGAEQDRHGRLGAAAHGSRAERWSEVCPISALTGAGRRSALLARDRRESWTKAKEQFRRVLFSGAGQAGRAAARARPDR